MGGRERGAVQATSCVPLRDREGQLSRKGTGCEARTKGKGDIYMSLRELLAIDQHEDCRMTLRSHFEGYYQKFLLIL